MEALRWWGLDLTELKNGEYVQMGWRWNALKTVREYLVSGIIGGVRFSEEYVSDDTTANKTLAHEFFWAKEEELHAQLDRVS